MRWRRELAHARAAGRPEPAPPDVAPISLNLDLTTACNYRCDHCIDWDILNTKHRHADTELRASIQSLCERGLRSLILIGGGEPTLYAGFESFVRFAKGLGLQIAVVSNGGQGDKLLAVADALTPGDWLRLSLDAGSDERFRAMHRPASRSLTLDEICAWVPRIKARNPGLRIGYSYIIVWRGASRDGVSLHENIDEIVLATQRARRFGFDFIALKPVLERAPGGAEVMDPAAAQEELSRVVARIRDEVEKARALASDTFSIHVSTNLRVLEAGNWSELTRQPRTCHVQALRQVLTPLGLYNCPAHRGVERARIAGKDAFADAERTRRTGLEFAALLDRFDASSECREVTCLYNGVNWWLEKMIEDPREDVEILPGDERLDHFL